ncbi:ATPase domain-containing protein [Azospirillum halopraeferens]|uniref:ATPase domain-containing protein n=1 Tax=Azospirillum halopraeferens TaxID=34010 RepID=UPI0003FD4F5F|nr:ATPase domain-containing protein [Azospirillum halopraeferens]
MTEPRNDLSLMRVPSGIAGLDRVLSGGFLRGGVYIVQGVPGAGKTILANQMCFNHVARGGRAVYVTLLAESHARMLQHLGAMSFYDEGAIPDRLYYVSAFKMLEDDGLKGLLDMLRREIRGQRASLVVLDGLVAAEETAPSDREFKKFIHEVQMHAAMNDCTTLLLTSGGTGRVSPEHTMVDGLIELDDRVVDVRTERSLLVRKFRGSASLRGRHAFRITGNGLVVFPRIEAAFATPSRPDHATHERVASGVDGLDEVLDGGFFRASTTVLFGPTGTGKTTAGLQFLASAREDDPGLLFGFYETPDRLRVKAESLGIDLAGLEARGAVDIVWQAQGENLLDELGYRLLDAVERRGARRLFVDGLGAIVESTADPQRMSRFVAALSNELRVRGVTTLYTLESSTILGPALEVPIRGISSLAECLIALRHVEVEATTRRVLSILKVRNSGFDPALREFEITGRGMRLVGPFRGYERILSGYAHSPDRDGHSPAVPPSPQRPSRRE